MTSITSDLPPVFVPILMLVQPAEIGKAGSGSSLVLADSGYALANPPEWVEKLHPQVILLSMAPGDREDRPSAEMLEVLQGKNRLDQIMCANGS